MADHPSGRHLFRAYIDETGDRGTGPKSSTCFAMAGVIVRDKNGDHLDQCLADVNAHRQGTGKLKWTGLRHPERTYATAALGGLPIRIVYVIVPKVSIRADSMLFRDSGAFYNFAARIIFERISWIVNDAGGLAKVTYEKVRGFPTYETTDYLELLRQRRDRHIEWAAVHKAVEVRGAGEKPRLQLADLAAGALDAAIRPDKATGLVEPTYLFNLEPVIARRGRAWERVQEVGIKVLGDTDIVYRQPWWPGPFEPHRK